MAELEVRELTPEELAAAGSGRRSRALRQPDVPVGCRRRAHRADRWRARPVRRLHGRHVVTPARRAARSSRRRRVRCRRRPGACVGEHRARRAAARRRPTSVRPATSRVRLFLWSLYSRRTTSRSATGTSGRSRSSPGLQGQGVGAAMLLRPFCARMDDEGEICVARDRQARERRVLPPSRLRRRRGDRDLHGLVTWFMRRAPR